MREAAEAMERGLEYGTLSNVDVRKWYLEQQARQSFKLRNQYRTQARALMEDRQLAESLYATNPNLTWEQVIQKQIDKGLSGDDIYKEIIESSQRSRVSVNQSLGLEQELHKDSTEYDLIWHEDVGNYIYSLQQDETSIVELEQRLNNIVIKLNEIIKNQLKCNDFTTFLIIYQTMVLNAMKKFL